MAQVPINTVELREHGDPVLLVNGIALSLGDSTRGRYGIDAVVDERLVRYVALLGLRRRSGLLDGWTTSDELGHLADAGGTGDAAAKFLERRLLPYPPRREDTTPLSEVERVSGHLIAFEERHTNDRNRQQGGLSRGPYRLGVASAGIRIDDHVAWRWLYPSVIAPPSSFDGATPAAAFLGQADQQFAAGDIVGARALAATGARQATAELSVRPGDRDHRFLLASLLDLVGNLDMELGLPRSSLSAASTAARWFAALRHPLGAAHAYQVQAHALGQLDELSNSVDAAKRAMNIIDRARAARSGPGRAGYSGVLGQRLSKAGRHQRGERHLMFALRTCEQAGLTMWAGVWSLRLCENRIATGQLADAEAHLERAHCLLASTTTNVPQDAALTRVTAQFLTAASRVGEAEHWARKAYRIGVEKSMANQVRLTIPILRDLGILGEVTSK